MKCQWQCLLLVLFTLSPLHSFAGVADVVNAKAVCDAQSTCDITVTVRHDDSGWDHYADQWQIESLNGDVLGVRVLHHPHVHEQPFSRSLKGVSIPCSIKKVRIRARDSVHGFGGMEVILELDR